MRRRATCGWCCAGRARCCSWAPRPTGTRLLTFLGLREELRARCPGAEYFDLRFRDRIYAKQPPEPVATRGAAPAPAVAGAAAGSVHGRDRAAAAPAVSQLVAVPETASHPLPRRDTER